MQICLSDKLAVVAFSPSPRLSSAPRGSPWRWAPCLTPGGGGEDQEAEELPGVLHWGHLLETSPDKKIFKCRVKREKSQSCFPSVTIELFAPQLQAPAPASDVPSHLKGRDTTPVSCVTVSRAAPLQGTQSPSLPQLTEPLPKPLCSLSLQPSETMSWCSCVKCWDHQWWEPPHLGFLL